MADSTWSAVDLFIHDTLVPADEITNAILESSESSGLPSIQVSPSQGKLLQLLVTISGAKRILEIGTLGGYSAIWMAGALPAGGRLISLELEQRHADVARANIARAGLADKAEVRVGAALDLLPGLAEEVARTGERFDLVFIDADKSNMPRYLEWALKVARPGATIIGDNVVRGGQVANASSSDPDVQGVRRFLQMLGSGEGTSATAIQTVGVKGYDGFAIAVVRQTE